MLRGLAAIIGILAICSLGLMVALTQPSVRAALPLPEWINAYFAEITDSTETAETPETPQTAGPVEVADTGAVPGDDEASPSEDGEASPETPEDGATDTNSEETDAPVVDVEAPPPPPPSPLETIEANAVQGGFIRGAAPVDMAVLVNGEAPLRSATGGFFIGVDRNQTGTVTVSLPDEAEPNLLEIAVEEREFAQGQVITTTRSLGLPADSDPSDDPLGFDDLFPEEDEPGDDALVATTRSLGGETAQQRRQREWGMKANALSSQSDGVDGFLQDWIYPIRSDWRETSPWGASRIKNGKEKIHFGIDMAAPTGTELVAPADGVVTLAASNFYFEGGVVFIDHGTGLTSIYLHMSEIDVEQDQLVEQGDRIGAVGATGSASGPHLCWRLYHEGREKRLDPTTFVKADAD